MIPILYEHYEIQFASNGLGRLADCLSCVVTEERNGIYECEFTYPITGEMFSEIQEGRIIGVIHDDVKDIQPFDIYARTAPLNGVVTFYARHISYRLRNVILKPFTASSCAAALAAMATNSYNTNPFSFWTDKIVNGTFKVDVPSGCKSVLMGQEGSILDVYGTGEYEWDKWSVKLHTHRGTDNGVAIRYGVNLLDITQNIDESDSYSAVAPFWKSAESDETVMLPEGIIIADSVTVDKHPWTTETGEEIKTNTGEVLEFNAPNVVPVPMDLSTDFETAPTVAQLRQRALSRLNSSEAWLPSNNLTVKFVDLAHTEDYKNVAALQRVSLCDYVGVYCGPVGVNAVSMKVIRVVYDVLGELYNEIEIGSPKSSFGDVILAQIDEKFSELETKTVSIDTLKNAVDNATDQITGAKGGHLLDIYDANGNRQEMLVMDTEDVGTATKVWRFNLGGMGYSSNGYGGPYTTAITQDGNIVADFITTGKLTANLIKAGRLASVANTSNFWDMVSGEFSLKSNGATTGIVYQNGVLTIDATNIKTGTLNGNDVAVTNLSASNIKTGTLNGNDVNVTNLNASNIKTGTLNGNDVNVTNLNASNIKTGTLNGNDVTITNLNASNINSGTLNAQYIDASQLHVKAANIDGALVIGQLPSNVAVDSDLPTKVSELTNDKGYQNSTQVTTIAGNVISTAELNADNITTGTLSADVIGANSINVSKLSGSISKTSTGGTTAWVIDLNNGSLTLGDINASNIKAGTIQDATGVTSWSLASGMLQNTYHFNESGAPEYHTRTQMTGGQIRFLAQNDDAGATYYTQQGCVGATGSGVSLFDNRARGYVAIETGSGAGDFDSTALTTNGRIIVNTNSSTQSTIWLHSTRLRVGTSNDVRAHYGANGTFTSADGKTVTVTSGIITSIA